jgi:hypothetical protein
MTTRLGSPALVLVSPHTQTALTYVRGALFNPVSMSVMAFGVCAGVGFAGWLGAIVALGVLIAIGSSVTKYPLVRRHLDQQFEFRLRQRREADRLRQLKPTGPVRQQQYIDLRDLVDHFVRLAVSHQRCLDALRFAGSSDLPRVMPMAEPNRSTRRRDIMQRRLRHRDECVRRIERLADELEGVDELVRLVAQRVACPALDGEIDRVIERRLCELDEVDAALDQLSA